MPRITRAVIGALLGCALAASPLSAQDTIQAAPDSLAAELGALRADVARLTQSFDSLNASLLGSATAPAEEALTLESAPEGVRLLGLRSALAILVLVLTGLTVRLASWVLGQLAERTVEQRLFFKRIEPVLRITL